MFDPLPGRRRNKPIPERSWNRLENRKPPKNIRTEGFFGRTCPKAVCQATEETFDRGACLLV
jgi:hypothetical protein